MSEKDTDQSRASRPVPSVIEPADTDTLKFIASRITAADWISRERAEYADVKYEETRRHHNDLDMHTFGLTTEGLWFVFLTNYLKRAQVLGVDTPQGRQAFGKFVVTAMSAFETMIRTEGKPPEPGVPSGEIREWVQQ